MKYLLNLMLICLLTMVGGMGAGCALRMSNGGGGLRAMPEVAAITGAQNDFTLPPGPSQITPQSSAVESNAPRINVAVPELPTGGDSQAIFALAPIPKIDLANAMQTEGNIPASAASPVGSSGQQARLDSTVPKVASDLLFDDSTGELVPAARNPPVYSRRTGNYQIEVGDSLEIKFRGSTPELDAQVTVRPDGMISLQIVGDVLAAGLTPELLRATLKSAYAAELEDPDLTVVVKSFSGNSIYVGGEVASPGRVPLIGRVTTLKAIIMAGGFKDTADKRRVVVRRSDGTCCEYDLKSVIECKAGGQDIQLRPYDVVYVRRSHIAKVNLFVEQYIEKVVPFSRSFGVFISHNTGLPGAIAGP